MSIVLSDLAERLDTLTKLVLAEPVARIGHSRVTVRPLTLRGKAFFQLEYQQGQKVAHRNVARGALLETFEQELDGLFRSVTLCTETETRQYVRKTNGAYKCTAKSGAARAAVTASHNRKKEYILQEGENIPALVDLGVFTPDFKIVKAKYDKYKQINRFIELVDDAFRAYGRDEITILDFGCGKSYLTFVLYYYFAVKRGVRAKIIGYDLKEDVVEHCNEVAARYGYSDLHFVVADVTRDVLYSEHIDMLVTLHACDVATDYALHYAISRGVEHIFSVPCCQHEVNKTIQKGGDFGDKGGEFQPCADVVLVLSEELRQGLHGMASALDKPLIGCGFLHGCYVLALQVLGNRHFLGFLVRQLGYDCGNFVPARNDGRTVTAFPENNPVTVCSVNGAYGDGLQHALPFDALGKFVKGCFIEAFAWVEAARLNVCQRYHRDVSLCC